MKSMRNVYMEIHRYERKLSMFTAGVLGDNEMHEDLFTSSQIARIEN